MNQVRNIVKFSKSPKSRGQAGFTIIELTLAMAFIAMLLLGIAMLTLQIGSVYNKGLTLRSVNESGQLVSSDIARTLNSARPASTLFVENSPATGGRLCGNNVVYAWNYAKSIKEVEDGQPVTLFNEYQDSSERIRLIRFTGADSFCKQVSGAYPQLSTATIDSITNLLGAGDNNLAVTKFSINRDIDGLIGLPVANDSGQRIYQLSITIGTGEDAVIQGSSCKNEGSRLDNDYCAVNEFNFTARAGAKGV